jgi:hypothetical protein
VVWDTTSLLGLYLHLVSSLNDELYPNHVLFVLRILSFSFFPLSPIWPGALKWDPNMQSVIGFQVYPNVEHCAELIPRCVYLYTYRSLDTGWCTYNILLDLGSFFLFPGIVGSCCCSFLFQSQNKEKIVMVCNVLFLQDMEVLWASLPHDVKTHSQRKTHILGRI